MRKIYEKIISNCHRCSKKIELEHWQYVAGRRDRRGHFYCSSICRVGSLEERFWKKVKKLSPEGCWLWTGGVSSRGYGRLTGGGKTLSAHRVSYELHFDKIGSSQKFVCHKCDNPLCVNPTHLFLGTAKDNAIDCSKKGRNGSTKGAKRRVNAEWLIRRVLPILNKSDNSYRHVLKEIRRYLKDA